MAVFGLLFDRRLQTYIDGIVTRLSPKEGIGLLFKILDKEKPFCVPLTQVAYCLFWEIYLLNLL